MIHVLTDIIVKQRQTQFNELWLTPCQQFAGIEDTSRDLKIFCHTNITFMTNIHFFSIEQETHFDSLFFLKCFKYILVSCQPQDIVSFGTA